MTPISEESNDVSEMAARFTVSPESIATRNKNLLWGLLFGLVLVAVVAVAHRKDPETFNDLLLWSVLGFVVLGNLVNFIRHLRYLRLIREHRVEVYPDRVQFWTGGEMTELNRRDIAGVFLYRRKGILQHIQVRLRNNRGIRLEGYEGMDRLAELLEEPIPAP